MVILGYDSFADGQPVATNGFKSKNGVAPINMGFAAYDTPPDVRDDDLNSGHEKFPLRFTTHGFGLSHEYDIQLQPVSEIKGQYYYVIDIFPHDFWTNPDARYMDNISDQAISDIKNGKAKILVLFIQEAIYPHVDASAIFNTWATNYNLPNGSIVVVSGNCGYNKFLKKDKAVVYIPHTAWEFTHLEKCTEELIQQREKNIIERKKRKKIFLCYNRRNKDYRMHMVYSIFKNNLMDFGFTSLGANLTTEGYDPEFVKLLPMTFDNTDLQVNQARSFIEEDFSESYVSVVTETDTRLDNIFMTEKTFKPIVAMHPFFVLASIGFLKELRNLGYQTFPRWFDESYDEEPNMHKRIEIITRQLKELSQKNEDELQDMLIQMLPTLKHNIDIFLKRSKSKEFQKTLETELWK